MSELLEFYATCSKGFEQLLAEELKRLKAQRVRPLKGGVAFFGTKTDGYRICLWSRMASRVLRVVARVSAQSADELYRDVTVLSWMDFIGPDATIAVKARGGNSTLHNSQFCALKVKDAICDSLRAQRGVRPNVAPQRPDVPIWVSIHHKKATIYLDYAGEPLHKRGYRLSDKADKNTSLSETLAAGMLVWGGWDRLASPAVRHAHPQGEDGQDTMQAPAFVDVRCTDATLVLEAAMMATDRAPGIARDYWGFEGNADFDDKAFDALLAEADDRFEKALEYAPVILGIGQDSQAIARAQEQARRAGLSRIVSFVCGSVADLPSIIGAYSLDRSTPGFIALSTVQSFQEPRDSLDTLYVALSCGLDQLTSSWRMCVLTQDELFDASVGYDAQRVLPIYIGSHEATLRDYQLGVSCKEELSVTTIDGKATTVVVSSNHAEQFAARLRKMIKQRRKWAARNHIHAYRLYDADLPDYAVSIDVFEEKDTHDCYVLINEYQAPKQIDPQKAVRRFKDACSVTQALLAIPEDHVFTRVRRQARGGSQYHQEEHQSHRLIVEEDHLPVEIDLSGYLDTGLFLDHRITRSMVGSMAAGKRFLNLFAYTGVATLHAAAQGALKTTTVDMSQTYLDWARRNMQRAGFGQNNHHFVKADVLAWVDKQAERAGSDAGSVDLYDVVFLDPPTFSNSKTMGRRTWDIQRDHVMLLSKVVKLVASGGTIVFSGNLRNFKLDDVAIENLGLTIENITAQTIPEDFSRNPRIHFCYVLTKCR